MKTIGRITITIVVALVPIVFVADPANAATRDQKLRVLLGWTQPNTASHGAWDGARLDQAAWTGYTFDWSTDYCSDSPDKPLDFDFRLPCWRHDFGYRNYKAVGLFIDNKARVDDAFYFDLEARCATYESVVRPACDGLAWTYVLSGSTTPRFDRSRPG